MGLKDLFNLDPTRYFLSNSAGAFRRVRENSKPLSLGDLMRDLVAPTIPTNLPTVNPIPDREALDSFMQVFGPSKGALTSILGQVGNQYEGNVVNNTPAAKFSHSIKVQTGGGYFDGFQWVPATYYYAPVYVNDPAVDAARAAFNPYRSTYTTKLPEYNSTYKPQIDTYNSEVSAYKAATADFKSDVEAYNAEASKRAAEANVGLINPDRVNKQTQEATGDVLAESDLYSDDLHNMMIERISTQPIIDKMSTMFSGGGK